MSIDLKKLVDLDGLTAFKDEADKAYAKDGEAIKEVSVQGPISGGGEPVDGVVTISHETSGTSAGTSGSDTNQTPGFGETASVPFVTVNTTGHVTARGTRTVTIPNTVATDQAAGLMSATDKSNLDGLQGLRLGYDEVDGVQYISLIEEV